MVRICHPIQYESPMLKLQGYTDSEKTSLDFDAVNIALYTNSYPHLAKVVNKHIPTLVQNKCYNYHNNSFSKEMKNTEIAHFFEHLVIEYLATRKSAQGKTFEAFNGKTSWNWEEEPEGKFHIKLNVGIEDVELLKEAIDFANSFLSKLEDTNKRASAN